MQEYGPVQLIPPGFLGFIGLKNQGRNPGVLSDTYVPSLNLLEWLLQAVREDIPASTVALATGAGVSGSFTPTLVVPQNETWFVHGINIRTAALGADTVAMLAPVIQSPTTAFSLKQLTEGDFSTKTGAGSMASVGARNFWMNAGEELRIVYGVTAAVTITFTANMIITRLRN